MRLWAAYDAYILAFLKNAIKMLLQKKNDARKVLQ
jgi:hypothetical protein